ncbi:phosphate ABC transporter permease PstA [Arenimonas caeni]|jgi:phosphate transport system permease protein|uniref:Phosphate transport system permease protein PstA n=1 Tax=Arenimonas caeni TaxID=2058085 RepID=A0A2P6MCB9_9GAMM|nr:phosphate ABC transporter permease PstA [Arenimonas caeni]MDY0021151.1 phosphate ABC transporter permease PstA [Arenimonas caeni]PRH83654.1 phosphate ABC transporter permease PtsA [Arenimonas caeni]
MATTADRLYLRRRVVNGVSLVLSGAATLFGLFWLVWILWTTISKGVDAMSLQLFTEMTPPPGQDTGGLKNAIVGSLMLSSLAVLLGAPVGIAAGTFLSEYARARKIGEVIRFVNDILLSAPSIVLGLFVYTLVVRTTGTFSGYAGSIAMAFIVLPVVVRTTDEMLRLVPSQMREAALSLGIPQWKVTTQILYRAALPGIVTGVLLALARIAGETAPLLFTAFNNQYWSTDMSGAMPNLPVTIFQFAMSPFEYWNQLAWAGAFLITLFVLAVSLVARTLLLRKKTHHD